MGINSKELRELRRTAELAGWRVEDRKAGHLKWISPDGAVVFSSSTPSCRRGMLNHLAALRRAGLPV